MQTNWRDKRQAAGGGHGGVAGRQVIGRRECACSHRSQTPGSPQNQGEPLYTQLCHWSRTLCQPAPNILFVRNLHQRTLPSTCS